MPLRTLFLKGLVPASCLMASVATASTPDAPESASLQTPLVSCLLGSSTTTYNPGLTNTPRDITYRSTTNLPLCLPGRLGLFTSAYADTGNVLRQGLSCLELIRPFFATEATFFWNDGGFSTVSLTQTRVEVEGATTLLIGTGTVTAGRYLNALATRTLTYANVDIAQGCLSAEGLKQTTGMATLVLALPSTPVAPPASTP
ncbi:MULTISPECIES: hypothetical protein [unclassified Corallococcus]|uniref:hypothetical protein n=1 Tax=unclassified Corallococcus TaxID=2685029 RepID=UPI001A8EF909|nr:MULTISPECIES: hypothetical protein [unclassified Corallococcus]MBN9681781.1 hypothetical protein [Corallococcus sp. NCSPR001]WAS86649.1 hypothetical protein O0N60_06645 [Corallococcus sp. NCRR]